MNAASNFFIFNHLKIRGLAQGAKPLGWQSPDVLHTNAAWMEPQELTLLAITSNQLLSIDGLPTQAVNLLLLLVVAIIVVVILTFSSSFVSLSPIKVTVSLHSFGPLRALCTRFACGWRRLAFCGLRACELLETSFTSFQWHDGEVDTGCLAIGWGGCLSIGPWSGGVRQVVHWPGGSG